MRGKARIVRAFPLVLSVDYGPTRKRSGKTAPWILQQELKELVVAVLRSMNEPWVLSKMKMNVAEWVSLQDQRGKVIRTLERKTTLDEFEELLRL